MFFLVLPLKIIPLWGSCPPCWDLVLLVEDLLFINEIMKYNPHLDVIFSNNNYHIVHKHSKNLVDMGVEENGIFHLVSAISV